MSNINSKSIYNIARTFHLAAQRCEEQRPLQNGQFEMLICPAIVNYAFACELFLKTILILHDIDYMKVLKKGEGHKLKPLFELLPNQEYKDFLQIGTKQEFESKLQEHSGDFIDWRYHMEKSGSYSMSPMFTYILMQNLETLARALVKRAEDEMGNNNEISRNL